MFGSTGQHGGSSTSAVAVGYHIGGAGAFALFGGFYALETSRTKLDRAEGVAVLPRFAVVF